MEGEILRSRYDGIRLLESYDWAFGRCVEESMKFMDSFKKSASEYAVNQVIEIFNVHEILSHKALKEEILIKYATKIKPLMPIVAKYFKCISDANFIRICDEVSINYIDEFWMLFEKFKVFENVSEVVFGEYINKPLTTLHYILKHKQIVDYYDEVLSDCLRVSDQTAELIIHNYMEKNRHSEKWYLPKSLKSSEFEEILMKYVHSIHPGLGSLKVIEMYQSTSDCPVSDKLRLEARKRQKSMLTDGSVTVINSHMGVGVSFRDVSDIVSVESTPEEQLFIYNRQWIKQNLDFATLLNNFIYIFGFVDREFRSVFPAIPSRLGVFERTWGVKGIKEYQTGKYFTFYSMKTSADMHGYIEELKRNNIQFEDIIRWFFEDYLAEEFHAEGFSFSPSSNDSTYLERCRNLAAEMDGVLKQYRLYVEEGIIDRELLEMSSRPVEFESLPSLRTQKYIYVNNDETRQEMHYMFSDQCLLAYIPRKAEKYRSFYEVLQNEEVHLDDYTHCDEVNQIKWLSKRNAILIENNKIMLNNNRTLILYDLYAHDVICRDYYPAKLIGVIDKMCESKDLMVASSLFSQPEGEYLNYILNKSQYSNGLDLRNRYIHSTYSENEEIHKHDYIELMKIMVLIMIKINEELCNK